MITIEVLHEYHIDLQVQKIKSLFERIIFLQMKRKSSIM